MNVDILLVYEPNKNLIKGSECVSVAVLFVNMKVTVNNVYMDEGYVCISVKTTIYTVVIFHLI